jgi:hypothetical protein
MSNGQWAQEQPPGKDVRNLLVQSTFLWCITLAWILLASGCATSSDASVIRELHLFGIPVAINMDQEPGPDGFVVRVYASNGRAATGIPIKAGRLEIVMTDGGRPKDGEEAKPLKVWTYDAQALKAHAVKSSIGWGYRFGLAWNEARPTHDRFTVVVRYVSASGQVLASSPSVHSMTQQ